MKRITLVLLLALTGILTGCPSGNDSNDQKAKDQIKRRAATRNVYIPTNETEFNNYNKAQKLYDSPSTIIWCSFTWGNANAPLVTVPIAGKLTSSSTTYFRPEEVINDEADASGNTVTARSVDGLFHPNPPQYRYAFTPGGQYVDFYNLPTFCTTALNKFQREKTQVSISIDGEARTADQQAQQALRDNNPAKAQSILEALDSQSP